MSKREIRAGSNILLKQTQRERKSVWREYEIYRRERESGKLLKKKSHIGNYFFQNQFSTEF